MKGSEWGKKVTAILGKYKYVLLVALAGAALLELTGRGEESPWFSFLNALRRELPVVQKSTYQLADGSFPEELSGEQRELVQKWRRWSYYKLQYKEVP